MKKRTAAITLAILGALSMSGCAPESNYAGATETVTRTATTYANITECTNDGRTTAECQKSFDEAKKATDANAPKFADANACAAQFNNCQQTSGGWFMPAMMGFMVGNMMNNGGGRSYAQPVYIDRDNRPQAASFAGGAYRPTPAAESYSSQKARGTTYSQRSAAASSRASTSSRGGFGGRSGGSFGG